MFFEDVKDCSGVMGLSAEVSRGGLLMPAIKKLSVESGDVGGEKGNTPLNITLQPKMLIPVLAIAGVGFALYAMRQNRVQAEYERNWLG